MSTHHGGRSSGRITRAEAALLLEEQRDSGLSIAAFARERDVPAWKLYEASRRRPRQQAMASLIEVQVASGDDVFTQPLELVLDDRFVVRIPRGFDADSLARVVEVLRC